jgi:hydrogenase-4 component F
MAWSLLVLTATPLLVGFGSLFAQDRRTVEGLQCTQAILMLSAVGLLIATVAREGQVTVWFLLRADPLSAWLDIVIGIVGATGSLYAVGYLGEQLEREQVTLRRFRQFFCLFNWYLAAMLIAANVENVAIMWISIEASTLSAALLIGF